jgi:protein SCO1
MLSLFFALSCGSGFTTGHQGSPHSDGTVLWRSERSLLVLHGGTRDRMTPGIEHYSSAIDLSEVDPGDHVDLWVHRDADGWGRLEGVEVTGLDSLPQDYDVRGSPLRGTVVRVDGARITVDHEAVPGVMMAMVMPFDVLKSEALVLKPSDRIQGTLLDTGHGFRLVDVEKTGTGDATLRQEVDALAHGDRFPGLQVPVADGRTVVIGEGQDKPTAVTFLYTTCPDPNFCPAVSLRMAALQEAVGTEARIVAITIDPRVDSMPVLQRYGRAVGANPQIWSFGRLEPVHLQRVALLSGLSVTERGGKIEHLLRLLILDRDGRLIERYDDNTWPLDRVAGQLRTGEPPGPRSTGTLTPAP